MSASLSSKTPHQRELEASTPVRQGKSRPARPRTRWLQWVTACVLALAVAGCGLDNDETVGWSANQLYSKARDATEDGNWVQAIKYYEKLEARYPYGRFAQQAQLEIAYAQYKDGDAAAATASCDRFIKLHPNHPNVDYAYYLKGLVNYYENRGLFAGLTNEDPSERDPKAARESFESFKELIARYPNSKYAPESIERMRLLVNALSQHEVTVARWYMRRGAYVAAVNRAQFAIQTYPNTIAVEEALAIMVGGYEGMGLDTLRNDAKRILTQTYPNSSYLARSDRQPFKSMWN